MRNSGLICKNICRLNYTREPSSRTPKSYTWFIIAIWTCFMKILPFYFDMSVHQPIWSKTIWPMMHANHFWSPITVCVGCSLPEQFCNYRRGVRSCDKPKGGSAFWGAWPHPLRCSERTEVAFLPRVQSLSEVSFVVWTRWGFCNG